MPAVGAERLETINLKSCLQTAKAEEETEQRPDGFYKKESSRAVTADDQVTGRGETESHRCSKSCGHECGEASTRRQGRKTVLDSSKAKWKSKPTSDACAASRSIMIFMYCFEAPLSV